MHFIQHSVYVYCMLMSVYYSIRFLLLCFWVCACICSRVCACTCARVCVSACRALILPQSIMRPWWMQWKLLPSAEPMALSVEPQGGDSRRSNKYSRYYLGRVCVCTLMKMFKSKNQHGMQWKFLQSISLDCNQTSWHSTVNLQAKYPSLKGLMTCCFDNT